MNCGEVTTSANERTESCISIPYTHAQDTSKHFRRRYNERSQVQQQLLLQYGFPVVLARLKDHALRREW